MKKLIAVFILTLTLLPVLSFQAQACGLKDGGAHAEAESESK